MARKCEICGKEPKSGNKVAKSKVITKRTWKPNVQKIRIVMPDGSVRRKYVCTRCLKAGKVQKAH
ncbi:MAG TPA: 50S ribosomal protein L28 [Defluviitoga sp.]|nr:50S ribosomal protein L28 [Defluviitoga sp.]HOP24125.1 50S ribosomal protein L28 [Defluviitoga sp.]HPZ28541.1 50S ribosomal protein L28 [Defluviitoga sp.]HQD62421.1 50S ribosomal protein L28 [Defluviitoga sp.]